MLNCGGLYADYILTDLVCCFCETFSIFTAIAGIACLVWLSQWKVQMPIVVWFWTRQQFGKTYPWLCNSLIWIWVLFSLKWKTMEGAAWLPSAFAKIGLSMQTWMNCSYWLLTLYCLLANAKKHSVLCALTATNFPWMPSGRRGHPCPVNPSLHEKHLVFALVLTSEGFFFPFCAIYSCFERLKNESFVCEIMA